MHANIQGLELHSNTKLNYGDGAFLLEKCEVFDRGDAPRLKQRLMQIQEV